MSNEDPPKLFILPSFISSKADVHQLLAELLQIEDFLYKAKTRQPGSKLSLPKTTADLDRFAEINHRNVLNHGHRIDMARFLRAVYKYAPEIGIIVPPNTDLIVIDTIINWFRQNIHAQTLIIRSSHKQLAGGAIIRIRHKSYDFSLNTKLSTADSILLEGLTIKEVATNQSTARSSYF